VAAGDTIEKIHEDENGISVSDINKLFRNENDLPLMRRATRLEHLPLDWREHFSEKLAKLERESA
jgi:MOSC domain-containing protein YiiM